MLIQRDGSKPGQNSCSDVLNITFYLILSWKATSSDWEEDFLFCAPVTNCTYATYQPKNNPLAGLKKPKPNQNPAKNLKQYSLAWILQHFPELPEALSVGLDLEQSHI